MSEQISFIHAADLHLDSPFRGLTHIPEQIFQEIKDSTFAALENLVETAIGKQVDFVLLVGDLFDNEKQSLKAQVKLRQAFEQLQQHNINVYISYGNHDYMNGNKHPITYPENVFVFPEETVSHFIYQKKDKPETAIYGFSYEKRAVTEEKVQEYTQVPGDISFHIAMLHGSIAQNTEHDVYAPFRLTDLSQKSFDYWALGHIHKRNILSQQPPVVYPGNTQGRSRKEIGEKGCYHVTLSKTGSNLAFIPLHAIQFENLKIDASACVELHQLEQLLHTEIKAYSELTDKYLLQVQLISSNDNLQQWKQDLDDVIELVNASFLHEVQWCYVFRYSVEETAKQIDIEQAQGEHFIAELLRTFETSTVPPHLYELLHHKQARRYLHSFSRADESSIKEQAKQLLIRELLVKGGDYDTY